MLIDIRPKVERILRQLLLAGLPMLGAGCLTSLSSVAGTGGAGGAGAGGGGGRAGNGGAGGSDAGIVACQPFSFTCGTVGGCWPPPLPDGGVGTWFPLTPATTSLPFDPADPRFAELYRGCVGADPSNMCSTDCIGLCRAVAGASGSGYLVGTGDYLDCRLTCAGEGTDDWASAPGTQMTISYVNAVCGRRTARRRACDQPRRSGSVNLGEQLARAAELEAESIPAFRRLAVALEAQGAPEELVRSARAAMADEGRHWTQTRDLARRRGGRPVRPRFASQPFASLEEVAIDNVIEGCVRETYGAMIAAHQAEQALDPQVRRLMTRVAADEAAHAGLSWRIDAWASGRLGAGFAPRRAAAAREALRELLVGASAETDAGVRAALGLPAPRENQALLCAAWTRLWQPQLMAV
jgi:hypothetical protein